MALSRSFMLAQVCTWHLLRQKGWWWSEWVSEFGERVSSRCMDSQISEGEDFLFLGTPLNMEQKNTQLKRKIIFQTSITMFHVNFPGCSVFKDFFPSKWKDAPKSTSIFFNWGWFNHSLDSLGKTSLSWMLIETFEPWPVHPGYLLYIGDEQLPIYIIRNVRIPSWNDCFTYFPLPFLIRNLEWFGCDLVIFIPEKKDCVMIAAIPEDVALGFVYCNWWFFTDWLYHPKPPLKTPPFKGEHFLELFSKHQSYAKSKVMIPIFGLWFLFAFGVGWIDEVIMKGIVW